jgi:hypothetical protein
VRLRHHAASHTCDRQHVRRQLVTPPRQDLQLHAQTATSAFLIVRWPRRRALTLMHPASWCANHRQTDLREGFIRRCSRSVGWIIAVDLRQQRHVLPKWRHTLQVDCNTASVPALGCRRTLHPASRKQASATTCSSQCGSAIANHQHHACAHGSANSPSSKRPTMLSTAMS